MQQQQKCVIYIIQVKWKTELKRNLNILRVFNIKIYFSNWGTLKFVSHAHTLHPLEFRVWQKFSYKTGTNLYSKYINFQLPGAWSKTHHSLRKYILLLHLKVTKIIFKIYWFAFYLVFLSYKNCFSPGADNHNFKHLITSASFFLACFSAAIPDNLWISLLPKYKLLNEWLLCQIATLGTFVYLIYTFLFIVL